MAPQDGSDPKVDTNNTTDEPTGYRLSHPPPGDEIIISGIAGYFPDSDNTAELRQNLFNKVDLVSDDDRRWKLAHPEIPQRTGKIVHVNRFDASFFGVHFKQAHTMDPQCRMLLEKTYEAVIDAGVNPRSLKNTNTGVFVGGCFSESEKTWFYEKMQVNGFGITGCSRAMLANRISYWLGITGPSYTVDSACSSSLYALEHAYKAIRDGHCDAAIVGGTNLCLHPYVSLQFSRLGVLSPEGRCRSFDNSASGYARSEAIVVAFLQKAKDARRAYSQILHAKTNCDGFKEQGITYPAGHIQKMLLREFYQECKIKPSELEFVEAHGTGTRVGDPEELLALDDVFTPGRKDPLKIGSVKSNLGHSEAASGLCSIAKMCIAYDSGYIPPNLHYECPREGVEALAKNRLTVVSEKTPWNKGLSGVNSFGFGGANAHVLLKNYAKTKVNNGLPDDNLPRLVCVSGRTESAVKKILDDLESKPVDAEQIRLLHAIHDYNIAGHVFRGYTVLRPHSDVLRISRETMYFPGTKRPVWFIFSGMGSQWSGMAKNLMELPIFAQSIEKCDKALRPKGLDIVKIITDNDPKIFENILHSFVGIAAVQIGLCDVLKAIGIEPDFIIGHSVGELGCAYADGCFDAEQMILSAYSRGLASIETPLIKGSMAAVGLGYQTVKNYCPPDIEVACHNAADSCTISGPAESMKAFVAQLQAKGIFAKEVPCSNIAYHSRYISEAGPTLLKYLKQVITNPKPRSKRWVSTSVPHKDWSNKDALYCSAEYHTNNLLSPVLFEETSSLIQNNAITIEIAPHGLLQAILRRSLKKDCTNIPLTKRGSPNQIEFLMDAIGKIFETGQNPTIFKLYPEIQFPVSAGTPMLSPLVEWEHSEDWYVTSYRTQEKIKSGERTVRMTIVDEDMEYMAGHVIDGRNLYPATGYLILVWETLALMEGELFTEVSVVFENVKFMRATNIPKEGNLEFIIMIQKGSGNFEIVESGAAIVSGKIYRQKDISQAYRSFPEPPEPNEEYVRTMNVKDVYKELRLRGYGYSGLFKGILKSNIDGTKGNLTWVNNWVTFIDTMLQMKILTMDTRGLFVPTRLQKLSIDATKHYAILSAIPDDEVKYLPVSVYTDVDVIRSGGVEIRGLYASAVTRRNPPGIPVLEKYEFIPFFPKAPMAITDIVRTNIQLILENVQGLRVKAVEMLDSATPEKSTPLSPIILEALGDLPLVQAEMLVVSGDKNLDLGPNITVEAKKLTPDVNALLFVGTNLMQRDDALQQGLTALNEKGFVISRESLDFDVNSMVTNLDLIGSSKTDTEQLVFLKKRANTRPAKFVTVKSDDNKFVWIEQLKEIMRETHKIVLISQDEEFSGILGLVNCLRKEPGGDVVACVAIMDKDAPKFNPDFPLYEVQMDKDLAINVYKNGQWGSYRHLLLESMQSTLVPHAYVNALTYGDLSSLRWIQGGLNPQIDKQIVHIYYSSLNFRDTMIASGRITVEAMTKGRLNQECAIGMEFAGRTNSGVRVMGMTINHSMANVVSADKNLLWPMPDEWLMEEGATVPVTYGTVFYAFFIVGNFKPKSSILIHAGTGGVGQAAIHVCLFYGCTVFTTVSSPEKREFLKKLFPQLTDNNIGNSRDTSFEELIMRETNGRGVDFVLNSLAEDKLQASVRCLASRGQFLEIGKFDIVNNNALGMQFFIKECSFHGIMMDLMFHRGSESKSKLFQLILDHIKNGCVKPICRVVFDKTEVEKAFRYMSAGKHIGKVLLKIRDEEPDKSAKPQLLPMKALPRYHCRPEKTCVIIGGLGGFGLELTDWLVLRGARKIVLNSRRGIVNGYQSLRIKIWKSYGVQIVISKDDVSTLAGCESLLKTASNLGPVMSIFNLAVVLKDALFENQSPETFVVSLSPKARATKYLDKVSRKLCPELNDFVIFSSVSCGRGNAGQTNYGMANSIMERICEQRHKEGYPALAIQWGAVGEVGLVADMQEEHMEIEIGGTLQQKIKSCLETMDSFLVQSSPIVSSMVVAEKRIGGPGDGDIAGTVASIMGLKDLKTVSHQVTLAELGMDSIMAVEIKQSLEREYEIILTAQDIRTLTFARLIELAEKREAEASTSATNKGTDGLVGLKILVRNIGDEMSAGEPIINMPTMISDGAESHDDICETDPRIFMIPGIEGNAAVFESLCKRIKCKATVLQLGYENPDEDIKQIAGRLLLTIRSRIAPKAPFILLGYSFGVAVTLEVARILEDDGHVGRIFCIDGAPEYLEALMKANLHTSDLKIVEDTLLCLILDILVPKNKENLQPALEQCDTWESKLELFLRNIPSYVKQTKSYQRKMANAVYGRLKATINYNQSNFKKLKSTAALLRPKDCPPGIIIDENYGLHNFFENPVKVHLLEGNHITIIDNKDCSIIINRVMNDLLKEAAAKETGNIVNSL